VKTFALGIPAYRGQVHVGHIFQAIKLKEALGNIGLLALYVDSCSLDFSRNTLVHKALEANADWLLMCDADTFCPEPRHIANMIAEATKKDAPVIAAAVQLRREFQGVYNVQRLDPDERNLRKEEFEGVVVPVDHIGTAFMAINCHWIRDHLPHPWFASEQTMHGARPAWKGEDFTFCDKVRAAGGKVLCDGRFEPLHAGTANEVSLLARYGIEVGS
jgi:hypothetical protein